jgi:hypothetical protein
MEEMVAHENIVWSAHRVFLRTGSDVRSVLAVIEAWTGHVLLGLGRHSFWPQPEPRRSAKAGLGS